VGSTTTKCDRHKLLTHNLFKSNELSSLNCIVVHESSAATVLSQASGMCLIKAKAVHIYVAMFIQFHTQTSNSE